MPGRTTPIQTAADLTSAGTKPYRYGFNGKESDFEVKNSGGSSYDYGARMFDPRLGRFLSNDPDFKKFPYYSPYLYAANSPILNIDKDGRFSIRNHYDITYNAAISLGYSKEVADKMAYFSSTYADHPEPKVFDMFGYVNIGNDIKYGRFGVTFDGGGIGAATRFSQVGQPYYVIWHSMMTDREKTEGMTKEFAKERGMDFGWNSILQSDNFGLQMQGIHALQDADAHDGASMGEHLDFGENPVEASYMLLHDCKGSTLESQRYTRSALTIVGLLGNDQSVIDKILKDNTYRLSY